jgi:hypothetical protein
MSQRRRGQACEWRKRICGEGGGAGEENDFNIPYSPKDVVDVFCHFSHHPCVFLIILHHVVENALRKLIEGL